MLYTTSIPHHACIHPTHISSSQAPPDTDDLLALAAHVNPHPPKLPSHLNNIVTPLNLQAWELWLNNHPNQAFTSYILDGIANGFRIGFNHTSHKCSKSTHNHPSANEHPIVIAEGLKKEVEKGWLTGPLTPADYPFVQILKKHSDKWRLILDLSQPVGSSVNDGIQKSLCSLTYMKVSNVVQHIIHRGPSCLLAKNDIDSAFRNVPVHPHNHHLLGMVWQDSLYIDTVFQFGLRSAPKIFNAIAGALKWIAIQRGVSYLDQFLDDFITAGARGSRECHDNLTLLVHTCNILNLPLALHKREGPSTCITFLGIELDTVKLELRLPAEKLARLQATIRRWTTAKCCKWKELESLVGLLHDASVVIHSGRTFLRRLIDLLKGRPRGRHSNIFIRLNTEARSDIMWWHCFISHWNGLSMMHDERKAKPDNYCAYIRCFRIMGLRGILAY